VAIYNFDGEDIKGLPRLFGTIVMTNGVFDILHRGHIEYLRKAKLLGDQLIVGINSDASVKKLCKGSERPYINQLDRAEILSELKSVDYVVIFDQKTPVNLVKFLKPCIFVKGADYTIDQLPEAEVVISYGGAVKLIDIEVGYSTTSIVNNIKNKM